jgi:hypothetical protein
MHTFIPHMPRSPWRAKAARLVIVAAAGVCGGLLAATPGHAESMDGTWANQMIRRDVPDVRPAARATRTATRTRRTGRQVYTTAYSPSVSRPARQPSITSGSGGSVRWVASAGCLDGSLRSVVTSLAASYGPLTVSSTCRSGGHNRRVGGAPRSLHLTGNAVDFRIHQNVSAAYAWLRSSGSVGGLKHYGGGLFHIDTGARRSW